MNTKFIFIICLIIIPLIMLYYCNKNINENFKNNIKDCNYNKNFRNLKYFHRENENIPGEENYNLVATNPIHAHNENFENRIRGKNYYNNNWRNNRYAKYENTRCKKNKRHLVATNPIHEVTEHFSLGDKIKSLFNAEDNINQNLPPFKPTSTKNNNMNLLSNKNISHQNNVKELEKQFKQLSTHNSLKQIPAKGIKTQPIINSKVQTLGTLKPEKKKYQADMMKNFSCKFFNAADSCPSGYSSIGANIGIEGGSGITLKCNGVTNAIQAEAVATITNGQVKNIIMLNEGHGYPLDYKPRVTIKSKDSGHGCKAQAHVDDKGRIKAIEVIETGQNYKGTPEVHIEYPKTSKNCQLCCKMGK